MNYTDRTLKCADCGADFIFTAGEQEFHASKGFDNEPRRCPDCRKARKAKARGGGGGGGGGGPRGSRGGDRDRGGFRGGGGDRGAREMFDAVCAECGCETRVPFRPSGTKPVYCSDCFRSSGGGGRGGRR